MEQVFEIWSEGYACTGERGDATYLGSVKANSFKEACDKLFSSEEHKVYYNSEKLTYWGCKLFDNKSDARRSFG
jgi:hypothetical protein